jgi:hypothetical protein
MPAVGVTVPRSASAEQQELTALAGVLQRELARRSAEYYPSHAGDASPLITLTPRHCGYSLIFQADLDFNRGGERKRIVIKMRREHKYGSVLRKDLSDRTLALSRAEYEEHVKAYRFFSACGGGLSVVRPLDFVPAHNALIVEHAEGTDLSTLAKDGAPLTSLSLRRCGEWWRLFHHDLHAARDRPWGMAALDAGLERRLGKLRAIGAPTTTLDELRRVIREAANRVTPSAIKVSLVHGDCKLRHVWATPESIQVLDFGNTKTGDSWVDPAALVVELSLYSLWSRRIDSAPKVADIRTLLRAYFDGPFPPLFAFYVVDCFLKKWHRRLRSWGPGAGLSRLQRSLRAAGLNNGIDRLYIDRWFTTQIRAWLALAEGRPPRWLQPVLE